MKKELQNHDTSSLAKLEKAVNEVWCTGLKLDLFVHYTASIPRRIKDVLANKGGPTKY